MTKRHLVFLASVSLLIGIALGDSVHWNNGTVNRLWSDGENWQDIYTGNPPTSGTNVGIYYNRQPIGPDIVVSDSGEAATIFLGVYAGPGTAELDVSGGTLSSSNLYIGGTLSAQNSSGEFNVTAGQVNMKQTQGSSATIFFITETDGTWGSRNVNFNIIPDGQYHTYTVDMRENPDWKGVVTQYRLDPTTSSGSDMAVDSFTPLTE